MSPLASFTVVLLHALAPAALALAPPYFRSRICIAPAAPPPRAMQHTRPHAQLLWAHALPQHARRTDHPIKRKSQGKRNLPANEVVAKWLTHHRDPETLDGARDARGDYSVSVLCISAEETSVCSRFLRLCSRLCLSFACFEPVALRFDIHALCVVVYDFMSFMIVR